MTTQSGSHAQFDYAWLSDIGRRRTQNQDSAGAFPEDNLYVVADGMGGHRGGEVASRMAVELVAKTAQANAFTAPPQRLQLAASRANADILEKSTREKELEGMGTTLTTLCFDQGTAYVGHVGDSRCYLLTADGVWQVTKDHSLVQEKFRAGMITREQMKTDRMKNVITRSVGFDLNFGIDVYRHDLNPGDVFLVCSDGLTGLVEDFEILAAARELFFARATPDGKDNGAFLAETVEKLIATANERGGDDNVTVLMVHYRG